METAVVLTVSIVPLPCENPDKPYSTIQDEAEPDSVQFKVALWAATFVVDGLVGVTHDVVVVKPAGPARLLLDVAEQAALTYQSYVGLVSPDKLTDEVVTVSSVPLPGEKPAVPYSTIHEVAVPFSVHESVAEFPVIFVVARFEGIAQFEDDTNRTLSIKKSLSSFETVDEA